MAPVTRFFWLSPDATDDERAAFGTLDAALANPGKLINESRLSRLRRVQAGESRYYVKRYAYPGRYLRRFVGRSRARAEWQNQRLFSIFGIPTARVVAFGESRRPLGAYRGVIVTQEVPDTTDLWTLSKKQPAKLQEVAWLHRVIDRLAGHVRSMHERHFIHFDLKWRNILVDFSNTPEVYIIDCPLGRRLYGPLFRRGVIKDLACLDQAAKSNLSRTQRLRFFRRYHDTKRLASAQRRQVRRILRFFEGRE